MGKSRPAVFFSLILFFAGAAVIFALISLRAPGAEEQLRELQRHVKTGEVRLMMSEEEVVAMWGEGGYVPGFGGHMRAYPEKGVSLSFPDDTDHAWYGKVVRIETAHPEHELFGVKIGDAPDAASAKLLQSGFQYAETDGVYVRGNFRAALSGNGKVERMSIGYEDPRLKDRVY